MPQSLGNGSGGRGEEDTEGGKRDLERKGASLGQLCWLLQALLTQQKDGAKASNIKISTVPSSPSVLVGLSTANSHRLASKGGCAAGQESGSLNFP